MTDKQITAFKGFDKDLKCRRFQYEIGKTYEHDGKVEPCESGFHACLNPFDVWSYYDIVGSRFCEVTLSGETKDHDDDSKIAAGRITIEAELTMPAFIKRAVDWLIGDTKGKDESGDYAKIGSSGYSAKIGSSGDSAKIGSSGDSAQIGSSGNSAQIGSSGNYAQIGSSGDYAKIGSSGDYAKIGSSGYSAKIGSSGYSAKIGSSGYSAKIGSSGDSAQIGSSGNYAQIGSSGDYAQIGSSGDYAKIEATGADAVIACAGVNATVSAGDGAWVSVAEFDGRGKCVGFATGCIGKDGLKAGVKYRAKGGKLVEAS